MPDTEFAKRCLYFGDQKGGSELMPDLFFNSLCRQTAWLEPMVPQPSCGCEGDYCTNPECDWPDVKHAPGHVLEFKWKEKCLKRHTTPTDPQPLWERTGEITRTVASCVPKQVKDLRFEDLQLEDLPEFGEWEMRHPAHPWSPDLWLWLTRWNE